MDAHRRQIATMFRGRRSCPCCGSGLTKQESHQLARTRLRREDRAALTEGGR